VTSNPAVRACLALGLSLGFLATACSTDASSSPSAPASSAAALVTVSLEDNAFVVPGDEEVDGLPALTIPVGTTVVFENAGVIDHTATQYADDFSNYDPFGADFSLLLTPGSNGTVTFDEAGTYSVGCIPHEEMRMYVIVE
jgi:plastocyanin